jgi:CBS domain containing-hemolysin-like protein
MEPQWSKGIKSSTICDTYYIIFVLYAIVAVVAVVGTIVVLFGVKMPKNLAIAYGFQGLLTSVLAGILMLFQYLVCSRALLGEQTAYLKKEGFAAAGAKATTKEIYLADRKTKVWPPKLDGV